MSAPALLVSIQHRGRLSVTSFLSLNLSRPSNTKLIAPLQQEDWIF